MKFWKDPIFYWYLLLYSLHFFIALNFNYIEGVAASTILYHLCDRNNYIQLTYSAYHAGFDFLLSFLPPEEKTLRIFSITFSFVSGFLMLYLLKVFVIRLFQIKQSNVLLFFVMLPFIMQLMLLLNYSF